MFSIYFFLNWNIYIFFYNLVQFNLIKKLKMIKKIFLWLFTSFILFFTASSFAVAPKFENIPHNNFWYNKWFSWSINKKNSLKKNIMNLFFPSISWWWIIWNKIRDIAVWLMFIFFLWAWALFVLNADDDGELKKAKSNILYLFYWAFLIFGSIWLLWTVLNVWWNTTTASTTIIWTQNKIIWGILIFLKSAAYYIAFIMMVYYWFKMMQAQEKEDKIKTARTWILNIILALVAIKVLDYIYFMAQSDSFVSSGSNFIAWAGKILGWILWVLIILVLIYAWSLLITSRWNEEAMKKSKNIIRNVFLWIFVIFLFIVIVFDLVKNFSTWFIH